MENLCGLTTHVTRLGTHLSQVSSQLTSATAVCPPTTPPSPVCSLFIPIPQSYSGDLGVLGAFLLKCASVFEQQPLTCASDKSRISFIMLLLSGKASEWATAAWNINSPICNFYSQLSLLLTVALFRERKQVSGYFLSDRALYQLLSMHWIFAFWLQRVGGIKSPCRGLFSMG